MLIGDHHARTVLIHSPKLYLVRIGCCGWWYSQYWRGGPVPRSLLVVYEPLYAPGRRDQRLISRSQQERKNRKCCGKRLAFIPATVVPATIRALFGQEERLGEMGVRPVSWCGHGERSESMVGTVRVPLPPIRPPCAVHVAFALKVGGRFANQRTAWAFTVDEKGMDGDGRDTWMRAPPPFRKRLWKLNEAFDPVAGCVGRKPGSRLNLMVDQKSEAMLNGGWPPHRTH